MAQSEDNNIDYSIVVCTYNPDERILCRCLQAVERLDRKDMNVEVILVDNNSSIPVKELNYVKEYSERIANMKTILVKEQGVKYARMAAIELSLGKYIVYFDYDNEPEADYLQELKKLNAQYPMVAAWGPGHVWVDFIDGINSNIETYAKNAFQERHDKNTAFDNKRDWQPCYPYGTGLCTHTLLLKEYVRLAREGIFTLSGRKGNLLSSGEDTQMVLLCISKGYAAGVSPALKIKHIIPASRANEPYLKRLAYGTSVCYETCLLQVFPDRRSQLEQQVMPASKFSRKAFKKLLSAKWQSDPNKMFELSYFLGTNAGVYLALQKALPTSVKWMLRYLNMD